MARKKTKIPRDVQKLQLRFEAAQSEYSQEYQKAISEYQSRVGVYEGEVEKYQGRLKDYQQKSEDYANYMSSFFITSGSTTPETFIAHGGKYYFSSEIKSGLNINLIDQAAASYEGSEFQFVKTGERAHSYDYWAKEWVPSGRFENKPYTEMVYKSVNEYQYVFVPGDIFAPIGSPAAMGRYEYKMVPVMKLVPETKFRQEWVDTSRFQDVLKTTAIKLDVGYLRTELPSGGFTSMAPEDFPVRTQPKEFKEKPPEAPEQIDLSAPRQRLQEEEQYFQREIGERKSATVAARRRTSVRPLLSTEGI